MGIQVGDNFDHKSKKPLDGRTQYATLSAMKAVTDANIPEGLEAYCVETDKYYQFKSTNTVDSSTGKWRERQSGSGGASALSDLTDTTISNPSSGQVLSYNGTKWSNGAVPSDSTKQPKILDVPVTIDGDTYSTVESAIEALASKSASVDYETLGSSQTLADVSTLNLGETHYYCTKFTHGESGSTKGFPFITEDKGNSSYYPYDYQAYTVVASNQLSTTTTITDIICFVICSSSTLSPSPRKFRICWKRCVNTSMPSEWTVLEDNVYNVGNIYTWRVTNSKREANWCDVGRTITAFAYLPANTSVSSLSDTIPYPSSQVSMRVDYMYSSTLNESDRKITTICTVTWEESSVVNVKQYYRCSTKGSTIQDDWQYGSWVELGGSGGGVSAGTGLELSNNTMSIKEFESGDMEEVMSPLPSVQPRYQKYSTEEQIVGEWIDGKTLYQRTYTGTLPSASGSGSAQKVSGTLFSFAYDIVNFRSVMYLTSGAVAEGNSAEGIIYHNNGNVGVNYPGSAYDKATYYITLQYTKS